VHVCTLQLLMFPCVAYPLASAFLTCFFVQVPMFTHPWRVRAFPPVIDAHELEGAGFSLTRTSRRTRKSKRHSGVNKVVPIALTVVMEVAAARVFVKTLVVLCPSLLLLWFLLFLLLLQILFFSVVLSF
jgi:hypothetical protein